MALSDFLQELVQDAAPIRYAGLVELSGLGTEEMELVRDAWPRIAPDRRLTLVTRLVETSEDNADLDFSQIFKIALKDDGERVRAIAVSGLWECEERPLMTALLRLLHYDPSMEVRTAAAQAMGKYAELAEDGRLLPSDRNRIQTALLPLVEDEGRPLDLRRRALEAAGVFSDDRVSQLIRWAYGHSDPRMQQSAIFAMGRNASPEWTPLIQHALEREEPAMRFEAAQACGELGAEEMIPHLLPLLKDEDTQVCLSSINALGAIGGSIAKNALRVCVRSEDESVSQTASEALASLELNEDPLHFK